MTTQVKTTQVLSIIANCEVTDYVI